MPLVNLLSMGSFYNNKQQRSIIVVWCLSQHEQDTKFKVVKTSVSTKVIATVRIHIILRLGKLSTQMQQHMAQYYFCCLCSSIKKLVYEKTTCQFEIKFITDNYLQMYKTLPLFTSTFTFNTNIFTIIKLLKRHMHRHRVIKMPS